MLITTFGLPWPRWGAVGWVLGTLFCVLRLKLGAGTQQHFVTSLEGSLGLLCSPPTRYYQGWGQRELLLPGRLPQSQISASRGHFWSWLRGPGCGAPPRAPPSSPFHGAVLWAGTAATGTLSASLLGAAPATFGDLSIPSPCSPLTSGPLWDRSCCCHRSRCRGGPLTPGAVSPQDRELLLQDGRGRQAHVQAVLPGGAAPRAGGAVAPADHGDQPQQVRGDRLRAGVGLRAPCR